MRLLIKFVTFVSLLLCLATSILWARSYWWSDALTFSTPHAGNTLSTGPGMFYVQREATAMSTGVLVGNFVLQNKRADPLVNGVLTRASFNAYGVHAGHLGIAGSTGWCATTIWGLVIFFAVFPILYLLFNPRRRGAKK